MGGGVSVPKTCAVPLPENHEDKSSRATVIPARMGTSLRTINNPCARTRLQSIPTHMANLADVLARETREGELYETLADGRLRCTACGHCCPLPRGAVGVCKVRFNRDGRLLVPWGYVGGVQCDPIEKKPFFHAYPGALAYSFGMLGCDLHCGYCQNWVTSQAVRDPAAVAPPMHASPELLVADAMRQKAKVMVSTYNEPLITAEWAVEIFKHARAAGLMTGFVSNGNGTERVLNFIR